MRAADCSTEPGGADVVPCPRDVPSGAGIAGPGSGAAPDTAFDDAA